MNRGVPQRIAEKIGSEYIKSGIVAPGQRLPSVRELATVYNCSNSSITHALAILEQDGFVVRKHGQGCYVREEVSLPSVQTGDLMGLIGPSTDAELMIHVYDGVERVARRNNLHVIVASSNYEYETERWQLKRMVEAGCRSIVLYPVARTEAEFDDDYIRKEYEDFPVVLVGNAFPEQERTQVVFDNYRTGYKMTEYLLGLGHKHIAFMDNHVPPENWKHYAIRERWRGFADAMREAGIEIRPQDRWVLRLQTRFDSAIDRARELLAVWKGTSERATAVVALEDHVALQTIWAAHDLGIDVPGELLISGFDNRSIGRSFRPAFPTSNPDFRYAGEIAARLALEESTGRNNAAKRVARVYMIPAPILPRDTVRYAAVHARSGAPLATSV